MTMTPAEQGFVQQARITVLIVLFKISLRIFALSFLLSKRMRKEILNDHTGFVFNARYQFATRDGNVKVFMIFDNGRVKTGTGSIDNPDVTIFYKDRATLARLFGKSPEESLDYLLTNEMSYTGNMSYLTKFTYMTTLLNRLLKKADDSEVKSETDTQETIDIDAGKKTRRITNEILGEQTNRVTYLEDAFMG